MVPSIRIKFLGMIALWLCLMPVLAEKSEERADVHFGGFVDTYYAYDLSGAPRDRPFTSQAERNEEFNINLAYLEAKLDREKTRGRLAFQVGTSVNANYAREVARNTQLGELVRTIQEAVIGIRALDRLWIDAGVYFSHIGFERFISKENWTYTRSLAADNSPYYQAGVRASYQFSPRFSGQLHLVNGWQNILVSNQSKALGAQLSYTFGPECTLTYNNFLGNESGLRFFQDLWARFDLTERWQLALVFDLGLQKQASGGTANWFVTSVISRYRLLQDLFVAGRLEYYRDPLQVIIPTATANGFQTAGASLTVDWQVQPEALWRNEIRGLFSRDAVFSGNSGSKTTDAVFVSSLALSL